MRTTGGSSGGDSRRVEFGAGKVHRTAIGGKADEDHAHENSGKGGEGVAEGGGHSPPRGGGRRESAATTRSKTKGKGKNWKANLMSRHIIERHGAIIGFPDPLAKPTTSPFVLTALKQSDILTIKMGPLKQSLQLFPTEDAHAICMAVQAQYNHAIDALKARELRCDSVDRRAAERVAMKEKESRIAAGFHDATNVAELAERIERVEAQVEQAIRSCRHVRLQVQPLQKVKELVEAWAREKRRVAEAKADGRNLFSGHIGGTSCASASANSFATRKSMAFGMQPAGRASRGSPPIPEDEDENDDDDARPAEKSVRFPAVTGGGGGGAAPDHQMDGSSTVLEAKWRSEEAASAPPRS